MNAVTAIKVDDLGEGVVFTGNWKSFARIAFPNLALTLLTLGLYRFWAKARERRYLWANTRILGSELEWTGTGTELLVGFLIALPIFLPIAIGAGLLLPMVAKMLDWLWLIPIAAATYGLLYFFISFARFRALCYRLSRTNWRGIQGRGVGSGLRYALQALGWYAVAVLSLGILFPWTQAKLWNERWRAMSFGGAEVRSDVTTRAVRANWAVVWLCFAAGNAVLFLITIPGIVVYGPGAPRLVLPLLIYAVMAIAYLAYQATFYRSAVDWMSFGDLSFTFDADFNDWLVFYMQTVLLTVATLGVAYFFYGYRKWAFFVTRLEVHGSVELVALRRTLAGGPGDAEGLADAFEIGAF
jgi:uncharacterized membrane protein YjgN (DUF898 family)